MIQDKGLGFKAILVTCHLLCDCAHFLGAIVCIFSCDFASGAFGDQILGSSASEDRTRLPHLCIDQKAARWRIVKNMAGSVVRLGAHSCSPSSLQVTIFFPSHSCWVCVVESFQFRKPWSAGTSYWVHSNLCFVFVSSCEEHLEFAGSCGIGL